MSLNKRARPGDPLEISAQTWNELLTMLDEWQLGAGRSSSGGATAVAGVAGITPVMGAAQQFDSSA